MSETMELQFEVIKRNLMREKKRNLTSDEINDIRGEVKRTFFVKTYYENFGNLSACCIMCGISKNTFHRWRAKHPDFAEAVDKFEDTLLDFAEQQLFENIKKGKEASLFFYLCNKGQKRGWQPLQKISGGNDKKIAIEVTYINNENRVKSVESKALNCVKGEIVGTVVG